MCQSFFVVFLVSPAGLSRMALETSALTTLRASRACTVCMCVKLWSCFHSKLDRDTGAGHGLFCSSCSSHLQLQYTSLDEQQLLAAAIDKQLRHSSPKGYRENTPTARGYRCAAMCLCRTTISSFWAVLHCVVQCIRFFLLLLKRQGLASYSSFLLRP